MDNASDPPPPVHSPPSPAQRPRSGGSPYRLLLAVAFGLVGGVLLCNHRSGSRRPSVEPRVVTPRGELAGSEQSTIELFENASPSVVYITNVGLYRRPLVRDVMRIPQGTGTGFIWDTAGHIVTNNHVIAQADAVEVMLSDQSVYKAAVVGKAPHKDLAVLRIDAPLEKLVPIPIGTSHDLRVGQTVLAIGNPFGLDHTLTTGVVSALERSIQSATRRTIENVIQTDAAINPGNSGGPLLDSAGRLIGVNTSIYSPSGSSAGIGFAVPVDTVNQVVPRLIQHGRPHGQIGIETLGQQGNAAYARRYNFRGVVIAGVINGGAAHKAGLSMGDIIQKVQGHAVRSYDELLSALEEYTPGDRIEVTVRRGDAMQTVTITLE